MTDDELLENVKAGLGIEENDNDVSLRLKVLAVKQYMLNAGITTQIIETELGITTLTIGVNDIWNQASGEVKFSYAFEVCLMPQLKAKSM